MFILIAVITFIVAVVFSAGTLYADLTNGQGKDRERLGAAWMFSILFSFFLILGVVFVILATGCMKHGWISPFSLKED